MENRLIQGPYQVQTFSAGPQEDYDQIILLLHGYSENGEKMLQRLLPYLPKKSRVLSPNGLFPLPKSFPLEQRPSGEDLLKGFSWYFYDATIDFFLIEYEIPAQVLANYLKQVNIKKRPVTIIGYSQGGYLAPFISFHCPLVQHIIGINCSFRFDRFPQALTVQTDALNGACDLVVDPHKAQERHQQILQQGTKGSFTLLEKQGHRFSAEFGKKVEELIKVS